MIFYRVACALAGAIAALAAAIVGAGPAQALGTCTAYFSKSLPVPSGWGASYDLFNSPNPLLASVDCTNAATPLTVGSATDVTEYVYQYAYYSLDGVSWTQVPLTSALPLSGNFYPGGQATANLSLTSGDLATSWVYIAFLVAKWNGSKWLAGCANTQCAATFWNLQAISRDITLTVSVSPVSPRIFDNAALGSVVGTITCTWSDASPCTATLGFASPYNNAGGVYAISGSNLIINPSGPGVGAAAGTLENVTIQATQ
jgi:hypothetical protein